MRQTVVLLVLVLAATLAQAEELPKRKSGLWEIKRSQGDASPLQLCVDEKSDNAFRFLAEGKHKESCKVDKSGREGDKWIVDATCTLANHKTTAKTHAVVTGKFDSAYKIESKSTFEQPVHGKTETSALIEQRWTGPCRPDQRPGDVILADGRKVNLAAEDRAAAREQRIEQSAQERKNKKNKTTPPATQ
jgi:hypothetical protein